MQSEMEKHVDRISRLIEASGEAPSWPVDDATVLRILDRLEYRCDLEKIHQYLSAGYLGKPPIVSGKRAWGLNDFVALQIGLEMRRQWKPFSLYHDPKKSHWEIERERAEASGQQLFSDIGKHSLEDLLHYIVECDEKHVRTAIRLAIQEKLDALA